ncbi:RING-H2 finger protein [Aspergillus chevalieri]|uniref:RING-type domain-containing protein n=1 Tax=Aspergillus chevalieri TaxID=182096 RepID=A0A7R7VNW1_ASPCH|nr:uncharacterized protein ACHE_40690S [Aspergillus chevalieri]BCR88126.1 hypothetical protein ACHE_40690S [Aspergillus chevalieri]
MSAYMPTGNPGSGNDNNDSSGGSPNTAMIILYSITGIITVLFLAIIITGAIRAHRHPERYGPRYATGRRSRQSRARGIARAMLETIPIVKFGDEPEGKPDPAKGDVEMGIPESGVETPADEQRKETTPARDTVQPASPDEVPPKDEKRSSATPSTPDAGNFSCPICTDDFVKGQDLRVLPCNHKFHPECIDPWLVNVSGTCPLCRIDLNPPQEEQQEEEQGTDSHPQTRDPTPERQTRQRRLTGYFSSTLNARRMREATVEERLAALRTVREEARTSGEVDDADEQRQRNRLSTRLRERFRIRTRTHGDPQPDPPQ